MQNTMKRTAKPGEVRKVSLVLFIILSIALIASIVITDYSSGKTEIFTKQPFAASQRNSKIFVDEEFGIRILGTNQNSVKGYDAEGDEMWSKSINGAVEGIAFDSEKHYAIVGSQDRNVYVYDVRNGNEVYRYPVAGRVYDVDYDQAGGRILVSHGISKTNHVISILDINTGEEIVHIPVKNTARSAKFSADKQQVVYGNSRGRVLLTDLQGNIIREAKARGVVYSVAVVPETGDILAYDEDGYLFKYDADLNELFRLELVGEGRVVGVSEDGKWIGAGTREGDVYFVDSEGNLLYSTRQDYDVSQVYFDDESSYVVTLSEDIFQFPTARLDRIGLMSHLSDYGTLAICFLAVLTILAMIDTFEPSRMLAKRFFRSVYKHRTAYLMLAPSVILILVFNYYNVFQAFYYAFTDWSLATKTMREVKFIGFENFVKMFNEGYFLLGTKNLLIIMTCSFLKLLTIPIILAEVVFAMRTRSGGSSRRRYWFRLLLVVPMVVPGVVSTLMWKNIYDPNIGALNSFLDVLGLDHLKHSWLGDESTALWAIIFMGFPWINSFAFLVFYGGLINIPVDLFEAAKVDGSNPLWNFLKIHLPLITPQLKMLIITTFIASVQDYGGVYLLTAGGPGTSTYVPGLELYYAATKFGQYGYACAMGLVMFIVILIGSILNMRIKTQELN